MNFISLRDVTNREIYDSFRGIFRISPNTSELIDDPTPLLTTMDEEIKLSDSEGNYMGITFIPKKILTTIKVGNSKEGLEDKEAEIINITQKCPHLYIVDELNIKPLLYISTKKHEENEVQKSPIQIISKNGVLLFPVDAPDDSRYINYNNKENLNIPLNPTAEEIQTAYDNLPSTHKFYSDDYSDYHVILNGKKIFKSSNSDGMLVPELYMNDYILGQCKGHTYSVNSQNDVPKMDRVNSDANSRITSATELSFLNFDKPMWQLLEGATRNSFRSYKGRYSNLLPKGNEEGTENDLFKSLFGQEVTKQLEAKLKTKAPLVGVSVQPGIIIYNAMPLRRYIFHTLRHYDNQSLQEKTNIGNSTLITQANSYTKTVVHDLVCEFALCNGKRLKYFDQNNAKTDYPNINKNNQTWQNWNGKNGVSTCIYDAIASSQNNNGNTSVIKTPPLFEYNQLSLRFLRGLNWVRTCNVTDENQNTTKYYFDSRRDIVENDGTFFSQTLLNPINEGETVTPVTLSYTFENNPFKYLITGLTEDNAANIIKDIHSVGMHYISYDYKIRNTHRHVHQILVDNDKLNDGDTLYNANGYYAGSDSDGLPNNSSAWSSYVSLNQDTFYGTYVMRSIQKLNITDKIKIKTIQDLPIPVSGGTTSTMRVCEGSYKNARKRRFGRCLGNRHIPAWIAICDGGYKFAPINDTITNPIWRMISSLPIKNKYGAYNDEYNDTTYSKAEYENTTINIDDSLPNPPSINLIPLIKI